MRALSPKSAVLLFPLFLSLPAWAEFEAFEEGYFQLRGAAGMGWLSADDAELGISEFETDTVAFDDGDGVVATLGLGYVFPLSEVEDDFRWFPALVTSIDAAYQFETDFSGDVLMYGDPDFDNYQNTSDMQNLNLMFNVTLALAEYQRWTIFVLGGAGAAWTWLDYSDAAKSGIPPESRIELEGETSTAFAFQGGAGIGFALMPELDLTLTYLYTDLGDVKTSNELQNRTAEDDDIAITAAELDLRQQSLLLGLTWNFIN